MPDDDHSAPTVLPGPPRPAAPVPGPPRAPAAAPATPAVPAGSPGDDAVADRADGTTGDPAVDEALTRLEGLAELPVREHVAVFDAVHGALQDRLADVED